MSTEILQLRHDTLNRIRDAARHVTAEILGADHDRADRHHLRPMNDAVENAEKAVSSAVHRAKLDLASAADAAGVAAAESTAFGFLRTLAPVGAPKWHTGRLTADRHGFRADWTGAAIPLAVVQPRGSAGEAMHVTGGVGGGPPHDPPWRRTPTSGAFRRSIPRNLQGRAHSRP